MVCILDLQSIQSIREVLNKTCIGSRCGIDQWWFTSLDLVRHLERSVWTSELEHDLEVFSISTYLNWIDHHYTGEDKNDFWYTDFPDKFLHYLEHKVSNPCSQTKFEFQFLILIRENITFITIICCVTWSMLTLLST